MRWRRPRPEALRIQEGIAVFARAIGNGIADNVIMVGSICPAS